MIDIYKVLSEVNFTDEEVELYRGYKAQMGDRLSEVKADYLAQRLNITEALAKAKETLPDIHEYTVELLFVLECADKIYENCIATGLGEELFINSMRDVRCKVNECLKRKHVFGTYVGSWYHGFIFFYRYALGRLQYDVTKFHFPDRKLFGVELKHAENVLYCHIPSMGRLNHEDCIKSYKMAYDTFPEMRVDGKLPIVCGSWLLYPPYLNVFGRESNTGIFARDFKIISSATEARFRSTVMTTVFDLPEDTPLEDLPLNTSMQRNFHEYLKTHEYAYGVGWGLILFDGEKVLTAR